MARLSAAKSSILSWVENARNWLVKAKWKLLLGRSISFGRGVHVSSSARLYMRPNGVYRGGVIDIGDKVTIGDGVILAPYGGKIEIGAQVVINAYSVLYGHGGLRVGEKTMIAAHCVLVPANHGIRPDEDIYDQSEVRLGIDIGRAVWLGAGCRVLDGVALGDGVVVAAGAVVTSSALPKEILAGVPARAIRNRDQHSATKRVEPVSKEA